MKKTTRTMMALLLTGSMLFHPATADAASYKVVKNKLVHAKTGKVVKGYVLNNHKLYRNGKLYSGVYKELLYKKGVIDKKNYYKMGNALYKNGAPVYALTLFDGILYKGSTKASGKIVYKGKLYSNGKIKAGMTLSKDKHLYEDGVLKKGMAVYNYRLYKDGKRYTPRTEFENRLYIGGDLAEGYVTYENKLFIDGKLATDFVLYNPTGDPENFEAETLYYKGFIVQGTIVYEGMTYVDGKIVLKDSNTIHFTEK